MSENLGRLTHELEILKLQLRPQQATPASVVPEAEPHLASLDDGTLFPLVPPIAPSVSVLFSTPDNSYGRGFGKPKSLENKREEDFERVTSEIVKQLKVKAERGNAEAQVKLGWHLKFGIGISQSNEQAVHWYRRAAESGDPIAKYNLGVCCEEGIAGIKDEKQAVMWYEQAARLGDADAQFSLARLYEKGINDFKGSHKQAMSWFKKAAENGNTDAEEALERLSKGGWKTRIKIPFKK